MPAGFTSPVIRGSTRSYGVIAKERVRSGILIASWGGMKNRLRILPPSLTLPRKGGGDMFVPLVRRGGGGDIGFPACGSGVWGLGWPPVSDPGDSRRRCDAHPRCTDRARRRERDSQRARGRSADLGGLA